VCLGSPDSAASGRPWGACSATTSALAALKGFLMPLAIEAAREEVRELAQHGLDQINAAL